MADDPTPTPAPAPAPTPAPTPAPKEPEVFSKEYVAELRAENGGWRLKAQEQEKLRKAAEEKADGATKAAQETAAKATAEAAERATKAETAANDRVIRAELRTAAIKAGMVDLDGLKLADMTKVKLNDAGEVEGADDLMVAMKEAKPYLFGKTGPGTTNPAPPPPAAPPGRKSAKDMTDEEYHAALKSIDAGKGIPA